ncbi:MAG TPA: hypothetical protein EYN54_07040 [Methylococcaceae bacterium]|nr:hypothetical protein [Methylococcaceae bacterium]
MNPLLNNLPSILGSIALTISVFTLIREVICWYFKINERVQLQKDAIANQEVLIKLLQNIHVPKPPMHYNCRSVMGPRTSGKRDPDGVNTPEHLIRR